MKRDRGEIISTVFFIAASVLSVCDYETGQGVL